MARKSITDAKIAAVKIANSGESDTAKMLIFAKRWSR